MFVCDDEHDFDEEEDIVNFDSSKIKINYVPVDKKNIGYGEALIFYGKEGIANICYSININDVFDENKIELTFRDYGDNLLYHRYSFQCIKYDGEEIYCVDCSDDLRYYLPVKIYE